MFSMSDTFGIQPTRLPDGSAGRVMMEVSNGHEHRRRNRTRIETPNRTGCPQRAAE
jgi:hypothetical protein